MSPEFSDNRHCDSQADEAFPGDASCFQQCVWRNQSSNAVKLLVRVQGVRKPIEGYMDKNQEFTCSIPIDRPVVMDYYSGYDRAIEDLTDCLAPAADSASLAEGAPVDAAERAKDPMFTAVIQDGSSSLFTVVRQVDGIAVRTDSEPFWNRKVQPRQSSICKRSKRQSKQQMTDVEA